MQQPYTRKVYDVVLSYDCQVEEHFSHRIREGCALSGLSFFLLDHIWVREFLRKLRRGTIGVRVLIDMSSATFLSQDLFYRVAKEVKRQGGTVINDPQRARVATDKARFHRLLERHGVPVPPTVVVPLSKVDSFRLTRRMRRTLGDPFIIKPAWGGGGSGVVRGHSEADIRRSIEQFYSNAYLLQNIIVPREFDGRVAWFRVFHVFGELIPCWWDPASNVYHMVSPYEVQQYGLGPLRDIALNIAVLSQMDFFSTEITVTPEGDYFVIDYLNDECDMRVKSYYTTGVPDEVVRRIAHLLVQNAVRIVKKSPFEDEFALREWYIQQRLAEGKSPVL